MKHKKGNLIEWFIFRKFTNKNLKMADIIRGNSVSPQEATPSSSDDGTNEAGVVEATKSEATKSETTNSKPAPAKKPKKSETSSSKKKSKSKSKSETTKSEKDSFTPIQITIYTGAKGIKNTGHMCFAIATAQFIFHTNYIRDYFDQVEMDKDSEDFFKSISTLKNMREIQAFIKDHSKNLTQKHFINNKYSNADIEIGREHESAYFFDEIKRIARGVRKATNPNEPTLERDAFIKELTDTGDFNVLYDYIKRNKKSVTEAGTIAKQREIALYYQGLKTKTANELVFNETRRIIKLLDDQDSSKEIEFNQLLIDA